MMSYDELRAPRALENTYIFTDGQPRLFPGFFFSSAELKKNLRLISRFGEAQCAQDHVLHFKKQRSHLSIPLETPGQGSGYHGDPPRVGAARLSGVSARRRADPVSPRASFRLEGVKSLRVEKKKKKKHLWDK